jgi:isoleucyl-tRNA synthetase
MDYSKTVNLPQTDFPMRGNLPTREPQMIAEWEKNDVYKSILDSRADAELYVLHDGPPYANGHIHIGHELNKILKDMIIKHKTMMGFRAPYVPGWDCHGLPIELQVTRELGEKARDMSRAEIRTRCREYARKFVDIQMAEFKRLGVFGNYENPYLTMSREYEAAIVESLGQLYEKGYVFKGKKPIYWCPTCETALAEAEVEYDNHSSNSIYVRFPVKAESLGGIDGIDGIDPLHTFVVNWTTTPWTLPANLGVCFHPEFEYSFYRFNDEYLLLADGLVEFFCGETGLDYSDRIPAAMDLIKKLHVRHPFIDRESKVIFGSHVTLDAGTGVVHTAPGHGMEDYIVGLQFGLEVFCPVDHQGRYTDQYPEMKGTLVFDANDKVIAVIRENGTLIKSNTVEHSYPHCWRCKKPLIFRATEQWFLGMEINGLRQLGLKAVDQTEWIPKWGESRFRSMVESRPDWCLSRQRSWGVPIPSFSCKKCGKNMMSAVSIAHFAAIAREKSIDVWYTEDIRNLVPAGTQCSCGGSEFEKEYDILDVWFDSGFHILRYWISGRSCAGRQICILKEAISIADGFSLRCGRHWLCAVGLLITLY